MSEDLLRTELETFESERRRLLGEAPGKYALITGAQVLGTYADRFEAIRAGYEALGNVPFLVKQILEEDVVAMFASGFKP